MPRPGEVTLSHRGVLFLDELPEFGHNVLEVLRQPLEDRVVTISRAQGSVTFPANFMLVAAMNPCYCGYYGDPRKQCTCSSGMVNKYQKRISGPLLDRIDIFVEVPGVEYDKLTGEEVGRARRGCVSGLGRQENASSEGSMRRRLYGQTQTWGLRRYGSTASWTTPRKALRGLPWSSSTYRPGLFTAP